MKLCFERELFIKDLKKMPKLFMGLFFVALGLIFSKRSGLGMLPWGVFHTGISNITVLKFGQVVQFVGVIVLVLSIIFVKIKPGIGTIMNVIFVGMIYDGFDIINEKIRLLNDYTVNTDSGDFIESLKHAFYIFDSSNITMQFVYLFAGITATGLGSALYISCSIGSGPRDGLFVGITQLTGVSVKYTKAAIEVIVTVIGILFMGAFGIGTFVNALISGYVIHCFFKLLKFDPKNKRHNHLLSYFHRSELEGKS